MPATRSLDLVTPGSEYDGQAVITAQLKLIPRRKALRLSLDAEVVSYPTC